MYNRYLSDDPTTYVPVQRNSSQSDAPPPTPDHNRNHYSPQPQTTSATPSGASPVERIQQMLGLGGKRDHQEGTPLRRLLTRFHLEDVDTGDLLLLILLFFLLEEKADDELLIALGILLIL